MKVFKKKTKKIFTEIATELGRHARNKLVDFSLLNGLLVLFQTLYILFRREYLNPQIPLWYTRFWGDYQLADNKYIFIIPLVSIFIILMGLMLIALLNKYFVRYISEVVTIIITFCNLFLTYELLRIFSIATIPFEPFIKPIYITLLPYFLLSFGITYFFLPMFTQLMKNFGIITIPGVHSHPSMMLRSPSARGGGIYFTIIFLVLSIIFVGVQKEFYGIYLGLFLLAILSMVDDYQNTHPHSAFKIIENPLLRLVLLTSTVAIPVMYGIQLDAINNSLQSILKSYPQILAIANLNTVSMILTIIWIVWFMNVLSWSNGVDGQYSGIVGIAFVLVAILSLRFKELTPFHKQLAVLSAIGAGISFGTVGQMWHPSKIMWGFGAMSAGLLLASLSFLSQSKIITSVLIILIPFLDAVVTLGRRMIQGKNPLKGDKGHLHHILISRGWSPSKVAIFYWITTIIFGVIALLTAERFTIQTGLIIAGIVAFVIILLNLSFLKSEDENSVSRR